MIFGLNALSGRSIGTDGMATGAWNSSDAEHLIQYTVNKGYNIHGWELGKSQQRIFQLNLREGEMQRKQSMHKQ